VLYVPNLIGYARIVFLYVSYSVAAGERANYPLATACYLLSFAGDLFDGWAARKFDQASQFGYVLDMVTDRCATTGLLSILCGLYPKWTPTLLFAQMLDLGSHWYHMYSVSTESGHHKSAEALADRNVVLRAFYGIYPLFAYLCVGAELTWVALYVLAHEPDFAVGPLRLVDVTTYVFAPACVMKNVVNMAQFGSAAQNLAERDMEKKAKEA
jgi:CDP-diacylglycerol--inositol 3-phosphatidyltransferase